MPNDVIKSDRSVRVLNFALLLLLGGLLTVVFFLEKKDAKTVKEIRHSFGSRQIVERCITCHDTASHKAVAGHKITEESCTLCHNGMGRGVTIETAHMTDYEPELRKREKNNALMKRKKRLLSNLPSGFSGENPDALLSGEYTSAGCLRCHPPQTLPAGLPAVRGWKLFTDKGCGRCHTINGVSSGSKGPELTRIGDTLSLETLSLRIKNPQYAGFFSIMPAFSLSDSETSSLSVFLKGQSKLYVRPMDYRVKSAEEENNPIVRFKCAACHKVKGKDGGVGPDLDLTYGRRDAEWVKEFLLNPESKRPYSRMPEIGTERDAETIANELLKNPQRAPKPLLPAEQYKVFCSRCHGETGNGKDIIAKNLNAAPRRFLSNKGYFRLISREKLFKSIADGINGTSMLPSKNLLTKKETNALLDYIYREFAGIDPDDRLEDIPVPPKKAGGNKNIKIVYEINCSRCHGEAGDKGARIIHQKFPQPRNFLNRAYMDSVSDEQLFKAIARGIPGTRMKAYREAVPGSRVKTKETLSDDTLWLLVDYVRRLGKSE